MADTMESLASLWTDARSGTLCAREQARAWALREAWNITKAAGTANVKPRGKHAKPRGKHSKKPASRKHVKARGKPTVAGKSKQRQYGMLEFVRMRVKKSGPDGTRPCQNNLKALFAKTDDDKG